MGCGASSSAKASAPSAQEGTAREVNASRTSGLQRDPATGAAHADPAPGAPLPPHAETHVAEQGNTSAVEDPLEKAAREAKQTFDARQQRLDAGTEASSSPVTGIQVPMYTQIGHENVRHAREQWKQKLDEPFNARTNESLPRGAEKFRTEL